MSAAIEHEAAEQTQALPPRRRGPNRRILLALAAVLVCAVGFIGGVEVQKGQQGGGSGQSATPGRFAGALGGGTTRGAPGQAAGGAQPTFGTVKSKSGRTLYVQGSSGTTIKVELGAQAKVTRTASSSAHRIHPGDTVVVQGAKTSGGAVKATSVTATAAGASGGGFGGFGGAAGGGAPSAP